MERGQRHLRRSGKPQVIFGKMIGFFHVAGKLALVEEGFRPGDRGHGDRRESGLGDLAQGPAHQLGLEQRQPPLEAIGP